MFSALPPYNLNEMNSYNLFNDFISICYLFVTYILSNTTRVGVVNAIRVCYTQERRSAPLSYYVHIISYRITYISYHIVHNNVHTSYIHTYTYRNTITITYTYTYTYTYIYIHTYIHTYIHIHIHIHIHTYIHTYTRTHRTHVSDRNRIGYRNTYTHIMCQHVSCTHTAVAIGRTKYSEPEPGIVRRIETSQIHEPKLGGPGKTKRISLLEKLLQNRVVAPYIYIRNDILTKALLFWGCIKIFYIIFFLNSVTLGSYN